MQTASPSRTAFRGSDRLELCIGPEERQILDAAAAATGMSVSAFVLSHATDAARDALAERTSLVPPAERWDSFVAMLDGVIGRDATDGEGQASARG